jgi:deoxyhypusine synthase
LQCDYSILIPFLVKALLDNRAYYEAKAKEVGEEHLFEHNPKARGYLRSRAGYRLYEERERLTRKLREAVQLNRNWLMETLDYPLG